MTDKIIAQLIKMYWGEIETIQNYLAASNNLDGVRAEEIKKSLGGDITAELGHAQALAKRIKELEGKIPGSMEFKPTQKSLQPSEDSTDVVYIIKGVIDAENEAISGYKELIKICDGEDYVTQDLAIKNLSDEEGHLREFRGYLKEYTK